MKNVYEYSLIIFDMDGTLYYHRPVQLQMARKLLWSVCTRRHGFQELSVILKYRKLRENWSTNATGIQDQAESQGETSGAGLEAEQYRVLAEKVGISSEEIQKIIQKWMFEIPLEGINRYRDKKLIALLHDLVHVGKKVVIYSDYYPEDKMSKLELSEIPSFYGGQQELDCMKPTPKGVYFIMEQMGVTDQKDVLVIGDRMSKDGQLAINAGVDYLIVKKGRIRRRFQYTEEKALWTIR